MISWIQRTFQHHFRAIFALLLGVIIISFIFTIGSTPGLGGSDRQYVAQKYFGLDLSNQNTIRRISADAQLSVSLQIGYSALDGESLQKYALQRLAALHLADEYHIPVPTTDEMTQHIKTLRAFAGPDGQFDAARYATVRDSLKTGTTSEADVARVLTDDWRASRVQTLLGGPGYVLPADVRTQLIDADTQWTLAVATADYGSYAPEIKPTDAELTKFYEENTFRYEIPPRVVASYIDFAASAYLPQVTAAEDEIKAFYESNPSRFPKPATAAAVTPSAPTLGASDKEAKSDPALDFAAVRPQVEAALKLEKAKRAVAKAASDVALKLFEGKTTAEAVPAFVAANKLSLKPLAPFTKEDGPAELGKSEEISAAAFSLGANRPFSDALVAPDGAVVLVWKETQGVRTPLYPEVKEKVATDYVENEKRKRFVELSKTIKSAIETRLKAGDDFEKAVASATPAGVKVEQKAYAAFSLRTPPADLPPIVANAVGQAATEKGQVSEMLMTADKGYFVNVVDKKLPDISETSSSYSTTRSQLASAISRYNAQSYIAEVMDAELKRSQPAVP